MVTPQKNYHFTKMTDIYTYIFKNISYAKMDGRDLYQDGEAQKTEPPHFGSWSVLAWN